MQTPISRALQAIGDSTPVLNQSSVGGGCISEAMCVRTEAGQYFLKTNTHDFFHAEAHGLKLLRETATVGVPNVLAVDRDFILLEWIPNHGSFDPNILGNQLASMHRVTADEYGLEQNNFIGANPQKNSPESNWVTFFGQHRLREQAILATSQGHWTAARSKRLERLIQRLGDFLPTSPTKSLLHGDLWSGNVLGSARGKGFVIDPAVYFGDRETDIAFSRLFGGFSAEFYNAYNDAWPLESGWQERFEIYNLYHLINHLNLFGEGYGSSVDSVLEKYGA